MANKVPVGSTIAQAYGFAFGGFPAVLGVVWLPLAIMVGTGWWLFHAVQWPALDFSTTEATERTSLMLEYVLTGPFRILELVIWVCTVVIEVGLTRLALGIGGKPIVFFTLGAPFWRMLGANLIMAVILIIVMIPLILAGIVVGVLAAVVTRGVQPDMASIDPAIAPWLLGGMVVLGVAGFVGYFYVYFRLWFFIAPVVVAEQHIDIRRAWQLAKGNVWRIFLVVLAIFVPLTIVVSLAEGAGLYLFFAQVPYGAVPDAEFWNNNWPVLLAIFTVIALVWLFALALTQSARAFAYRALVPGESRETVT